jgi:hypothetical protein
VIDITPQNPDKDVLHEKNEVFLNMLTPQPRVGNGTGSAEQY